MIARIVLILAVIEGGWLAFDGGRALVVGDYVTPRSGPYAGQLGPWAKVVSMVGIEPRSTLMKTIHLVLGLAWLGVTVCFALGFPWARAGMLVCAVLGLWYLPFGTVLSTVQIVLLLVSGGVGATDVSMRSTAWLATAIALIAGPVFSQGSTPTVEPAQRLVDAAVAQTRTIVTYDGAYRRIAYPGGDVPETIGVCTDLIIRAYRQIGVDLQVKVHEDMKRAFDFYPRLWGLEAPDPSIDHRRVPNLQAFLRRAGSELAVSREAGSYGTGDLVTWMLPGNLPHIGIVTDRKSPAGVPLVVHNIGRGPKVEDVLFTYPITGHYRYGVH